MTVDIAFTRLAARFLAINPAPSAPLKRAETNWLYSLPESDFPISVMRLASQADQLLAMDALGSPGLGRHAYWVEAAFIIGQVTAPSLIPELADRVKPWPRALLVALVADLTLSGNVAYIGGGREDGEIATCQVGEMLWLDGNSYYGMKAKIMVTETLSTPVS